MPEQWSFFGMTYVYSAYEIIKCKGYTSWAIGVSCSNICSVILQDGRKILPLSVYSKGYHGIDKEVFLSLPCVIGINGITHVIHQKLNEEEVAQLQKSAATLHEVQSGITM